MKKYVLIALCCLMGAISAMAQNGLAADGWYEYTVSEGNLSELISETEKYQITKLRLKGKINSTDFRLLRDMAGLGLHNEETDGKLEYLDLNNVEICGGGLAYYANWVNTQNNEIGSQMFSGSRTLKEIRLGKVTALGLKAFYQCDSLSSIDAPNVQSVGSSCFNGCVSLERFYLPNVTVISDWCFGNCSSLASAVCPSATNLSGYAFYGCFKLESVNFEKVKDIGNCAFSGCTSLKHASLPNAVSLPISCFEDCSSLERISLPNVKIIPDNCFNRCVSLVAVDIPNAEGRLGDYAFSNSSLQSVSFPFVEEVGKNAFNKCSSLQSISFPLAKKVADAAFNDCKLLKTMVCPALETICSHSFSFCKSLTSIDFPQIKKIGEHAFFYCDSLAEVNLPKLAIMEKYAFRECPSIVSVNLPEVDSIGEWAFGNSSLLETLYIPKVRYIDYAAFIDCPLLKSFDMPLVKSIGTSAFGNSGKITSISMHNVEVIGQSAFEKCNLEEIIIPNVRSVGQSAFYESRAKIVQTGEKLEEIGSNAFGKSEVVHIISKDIPLLKNGNSITESGSIIVPSDLYTTYLQTENWKDFYLQIIPDDVETEFTLNVEAHESTSGLLRAIGTDALQYTMSLTLKGSINSYDLMLMHNKMPNLHNLDLTETTIKANPYEFYSGCYTEDNRLPKYAFWQLKKLYSIKLPNTIKHIGQYAFSGCSNLHSITLYEGIIRIEEGGLSRCLCKTLIIPKSVASIGSYAFSNGVLENIVLQEGLLNIEHDAFAGNRNLLRVELPSSLEFLGERCFQNCESLIEIKLPEKLYAIEDFTFQGCKSLKSINLPSQLHSIESMAFLDCDNLSEIRIPPMIETIGGGAFSSCDNLKDIYVYIANAKDIRISQNTFSCWATANLHVPKFAYETYYWDTQWSQFVHLDEFEDKYEYFYSKNTITLDKGTGTIMGTPDATLHENGGLLVNDEEKQELDEIQLKSDGTNGATLIPENTGNIKAKKVDITIKVKGNKWHFFCFPFDVPLSGMAYEGEYVWRRYDGAKRSRREGGWQNLAAGTTVLEAGRGYIFQGTADGELTLSVENPEITASDVKTGLEVYPSDNSQDASWNFVGNPYVSYYSIDATTYSSPITIWNGTGYEAYRPGDDDYMFHPYQAFFVQTPVDASEIGFDATARESFEQSQTSLAAAKVRHAARKMNVNRLLANLELFAAGDTTYMDKTRIVFNDKENMEYDAVSDAAKFMSSERAAEFYTMDSKNVQYAINERPMAGGDVRMGFIANKAGEYRIAQSRSDVEMLLVDHQEGITHNLGTGAYAFSSGEGTFENRFTLKVNGQETGITELKEKTGIDMTVDGELCINGAAEEVTTTVYQLNGVLAGTIQGNGSLRLPKGVYAAKVGLLTLKVQI